jgi:zinc transport system substrate-binding protein
MRVLAGNTMKALQQADPANAGTYKANLERFMAEIDALDKELHAIFDPLRRPARFMVYHPAWGYFAADYDLIQVPVELEGKDPGPRELVSLIRMAKKDNIRVVFVQPQFSRRSAEVIARAINGRVQPANPLAENWAENLRTVSQSFRAAAAQTVNK